MTSPDEGAKRFDSKTRGVGAIAYLTVKKFSQMDGTQSAAAFAHYAFFSLFPLIILFVIIASVFIDRDQAGTEVIAFVKTYVPISGEMQGYIFDTITGVVKARTQAGAVAFLMLVWSAMQFFTTLISATNQAWGVEVLTWWRLSFKSLVFLIIMASAVLLAITLPVVLTIAEDWLMPMFDFSDWIYALSRFIIPTFVVFICLSLFYKLAPNRPTRFAEIWMAAFCATILLQVAEMLFVIYLKDFAMLNAVYGAFGGIMALLLWIYFSGCIVILGVCICAAQAEAN